MDNLIIQRTEGDYFQPEVNFNSETGICELIGESYLEDTVQFYNVLLTWLKKYMEEMKGPITFNFKITYFNTSSSKSILDLLYLLKDYLDTGKTVKVCWYYELSNRMAMKEEVEDFEDDTDLKIEFIPFEE